jgi:hypothetical protein
MEIPQGNTLENSGKQNPKMGFKSSLAEEENRACNSFCDFLIDSRPKNQLAKRPRNSELNFQGNIHKFLRARVARHVKKDQQLCFEYEEI